MSADVKQVPGEPIALVTYTDPWIPEKDIVQAAPLFAELEQQFEGPIFRIADFRSLTMTASDMAVALMTGSRRGGVGAVADPRVHLLMVGKDVLVKAAQKSMAKGQYGSVAAPPKLFSNTEDALVYARAQLASYAKGKTR